MDQNNLSSENMLNNLLTNYIEQPKYAAMTKEEKEQFKNDLIENLNQRISAVITINMPSEHKEEFLAVLERDDLIETQNFIEKYIPNAQMLIQNEANAFVTDLLSDPEA
jgi:hypothetical protein